MGKNEIMKKDERTDKVQEPTVEYRTGSRGVTADKRTPKSALNKQRKVAAPPMYVQVTFSRLKSIVEGKIYQVLLDKRNDERYVVDDNGDKVLFDKNIFQGEFV